LQFARKYLGKTAAHPLQRRVRGEVFKAQDSDLWQSLRSVAAGASSQASQQNYGSGQLR
jgi:hypothetical protein